jgi:hypothetical protein
MREYYELAEYLAASWRLANGGEERMPTSHGVLDAALYDLRDSLPEHLRDAISFGNTRVGFRCYELPQILYCAQANLLTSEPNPTYLTTSIQIDEGAARRLLKRKGLGLDDARTFGKRLKEKTWEVQRKQEQGEVGEAA